MPVIIGAGSSVTTSLVKLGGVTSVNFGLQASIERLWELGSFSPYDTTSTSQRNLSLSVYGAKPDGSNGTNQQSVVASTSCNDTGSIDITVNPSACSDASVTGFTDTFFLNSYSYSKENTGYGTESWSFTTKPVIPGYTGTIYILRGIASGQIVVGSDIVTETEMGLVVDDTASKDSLGNYIESESGNVGSGFPGLGNIETTREVIVTAVGGSTGKNASTDGKRGQVSISVPLNTIYV